jgi:hypothetical protein
MVAIPDFGREVVGSSGWMEKEAKADGGQEGATTAL